MLTITFSSSASAVDIQNTVRALRYASSSDDPTAANATRTVSFNLTDSAGNVATAASRVIAITAVDDAPSSMSVSGSLAASNYDTGANVAVANLTATGDPDSAAEDRGNTFFCSGERKSAYDKSGDSTKEFLTVQTKNGNTFFLVLGLFQ